MVDGLVNGIDEISESVAENEETVLGLVTTGSSWQGCGWKK